MLDFRRQRRLHEAVVEVVAARETVADDRAAERVTVVASQLDDRQRLSANPVKLSAVLSAATRAPSKLRATCVKSNGPIKRSATRWGLHPLHVGVRCHLSLPSAKRKRPACSVMRQSPTVGAAWSQP